MRLWNLSSSDKYFWPRTLATTKSWFYQHKWFNGSGLSVLSSFFHQTFDEKL